MSNKRSATPQNFSLLSPTGRIVHNLFVHKMQLFIVSQFDYYSFGILNVLKFQAAFRYSEVLLPALQLPVILPKLKCHAVWRADKIRNGAVTCPSSDSSSDLHLSPGFMWLSSLGVEYYRILLWSCWGHPPLAICMWTGTARVVCYDVIM